jgi:hypothetical protein
MILLLGQAVRALGATAAGPRTAVVVEFLDNRFSFLSSCMRVKPGHA